MAPTKVSTRRPRAKVLVAASSRRVSVSMAALVTMIFAVSMGKLSSLGSSTSGPTKVLACITACLGPPRAMTSSLYRAVVGSASRIVSERRTRNTETRGPAFASSISRSAIVRNLSVRR